MAIYYLDYLNGNDANNGSTWALAWKTITSGATAARIAPGDVIRIAKSPDPVSVGNGIWTSTTSVPATKSITSSTNATPIVVTITSHGYSNGDVIQITGHTTNTAANGSWKIANVAANTFELVGSVGNGVGGASGTARNINFKAVTLATAQNVIVDNCELAWTAAGASTVTVSTTSREGSGSMSMAKTTPSTATLYAYKALSSAKDYSAYQKITFWIQASVAITAGQWTLTLCSDAAGVTAVDTFAIPAIASANRWVPVTIARNSGGNLGASIQSIGLKTGATSPSTITILLDNICVATTSGLNLQSLISKNSTAQGGSEPWLPIQSINSDGTVILIDNGVATTSITGAGYYGSSGTATTYIRETVKTVMVAAQTTAVSTIQDSGTSGNLITFKGGYNTSSSLQDGETFFDGLSGFGNGIVSSSKNFWSMDHVSCVRYNQGVKFDTSSNCVLDFPFLTGCTQQGFNASAGHSYNNTITIGFANNNSSNGISLTGLHGSTFPEIKGCNSNIAASFAMSSPCVGNTFSSILSISGGNNTALQLISASDNTFNITDIKYNSTYAQGNATAFNLGGENNYIKVGTIIGGTGCTQAISTNSGAGNNTIDGANCSGFSTNFCTTLQDTSSLLKFRNVTSTGATNFVSWQSANFYYRVYSFNHGGVAGDNRIYVNGGNTGGAIVSQTTTRHTASGYAWQVRPLTERRSYLPLMFEVAQIAVKANSLVTFKAWVKLDSATDIGARLFIKGNQLSGMSSNITANKTADTNWEELTVTFTPTEAGVVSVEFHAWYIAGNSSAYIDDITVTQA